MLNHPQQISTYVTEEQKEKFRAIAKKNQLSMTAMLRALVEREIYDEETQGHLTDHERFLKQQANARQAELNMRAFERKYQAMREAEKKKREREKRRSPDAT